MIELAMKKLDVSDPKRVIVLGSTPEDLKAGKDTNCLMTMGVTNGRHGTHTKE